MLIAIGTPRILTERVDAEDGGGFYTISEASNQQEEAPDSSILLMKCNVQRNLFASITFNTLTLWSIKPEVLLSKVIRDHPAVMQDGENVDLIWKPDGSALAILTSLGCVHFYSVASMNGLVLNFVYTSEHQFSFPTDQPLSPHGAFLSFKLALEVDSGAQCAVGLPEELLICTNNPPYLLSFSWNGDVLKKGTALLADLDFFLDEKDSVAQIVCSADYKMFGMVTVDGKAYIATRVLAIDSSLVWHGSCIYTSGSDFAPATTIAFNPSFSLVAVGNLQGVVNVFDLVSSTQASISYSLSITKPGTKSAPIKLSAVTSLSWSSDGYALAVGWAYGGLSVWSVYGCLLTSTVSEDTFVHASDGVITNTNEAFLTGVQDLFWAPGDYFLFTLPSPSPITETVLDIYVLEFGKSSILTSLSTQHNSSVCIIASDRLLIYDGIHGDSSITGLDPLNWQALHIPSLYLASNWPIKYASLTPNGQFLAVAGSRGFAHYNFASERWKFFGNEQQEKGFVVNGIVWYKTLIIVSCKNLKTRGFEIRVYSRETKLDDANVLHVEHFENEITAMNLTDLHLLVFSKNCVIQSFLIYVNGGNKVVFQLRQSFSLQEFVGLDKDCVQGVVRLNPFSKTCHEDLLSSSILMLKNGSLFLIWKQKDGWLASKIADKVEHFWVSRKEVEKGGEFQSSIWVFDGRGAKILSRPSQKLEIAGSPKRNEYFFDMELDFYPFIVLPEQGVLVGIKQQLSLNKSLEVAQFGTDIKTHLFVHLIIQNFLQNGETSNALLFSRHYENLPYFNHALEMMLHSALESDSDKSPDSPELMLPSAIEFVNQFPRSLEIIVNCARKSEMALWGYFFSIAGDPKLLYQRSLESGAFSVATSYLIIIQTLEPAQVSGKLAVQLLEFSLNADDFVAGSELYRFLRSIYDTETPPSSNRNSTTSDMGKELSKEDRSNMLFFELLIQKKAKSILMLGRFRELLKFTSVFSIALPGFLEQEKASREQFLRNWGETLLNLHEQFSWPFIEDLPASVLKKKDRGAHHEYQSQPWHRRPSLFLQSQQKKIVSKRELELRTFLKSSIQGDIPELALLIAAMLLDVETLVILFTEHADMFGPWKTAMMETKMPVYAQLADLLKDMLH